MENNLNNKLNNNIDNRNIDTGDKMNGEKLQDAIGLVKDEYVAEAREPEKAEASGFEKLIPQNYQGNSWVQLAMNNERQKKIREGKGFNSKHLQTLSVIAACLILFVIVGVPVAQNLLGLKFNNSASPESATEEAFEGEGTAEVTEEKGETEEAVTETAEEFEEAATAPEVAGDTSSAASAEGIEGKPSEGDISVTTEEWPTEGEAFVLTAAEWKDNDNWPFFTNLVSSGVIEFPSYGVDPRNRIKVTVTDEAGNPLDGEEVKLYDEYDKDVWTTKSNKDGVCYLFYPEGTTPGYVISNEVEAELEVATTTGEDFQGSVEVSVLDDVSITVPKNGTDKDGTQVMFIVDTTGSMGDELAYLQMDFASIAEETADSSVWFSTNFYRDEGDEYVTKTNEFTQNLATVQRQLSDEYAAGGGDTPEAVADVLMETIANNNEWRDDCNKVAFLIFDAPPHYGTESAVSEAVQAAAAKGIHLVPVVASNAERDTELFGRALAIVTDGTYVFLTDDSGVGESHLEPIVGSYTVELLHDVIVRIINSYK